MLRHLHVSASAVGVLVAILFASQEPAPAPSLPFRSRTDLIPVDVSVLDGDRRPVRGLTAADFTVLEDGKPRPVVAFTAVQLPSDVRSASSTDAPAAWVRSTRRETVANDLPEEGRMVAIMIDRSVPAGRPAINARAAARAAVEQFGPGDLGAVVRASGFSNDGRSQGFTSDTALLIEAVESSFMGMTSSELNPSPIPGMDPSTTDCYCNLCVFETVSGIASSMTEAPRRRKLLLLVGSAVALQEQNLASECAAVVREPRERMMRDLEMANVTVHVIDPAGLITGALPASYISTQGGGRARAMLPAQYAADNMRRLNSLRVLPDHTGGRLVANNNPAEAMPALFEESQSYYMLGFEPSASADGQFHRIQVRVNRRGVNVRTRSGYSIAPTEAPLRSAASPGVEGPADLVAALTQSLPRQNLPVSVSVVPFPAGEGDAPVAVLLGADVAAGGVSRRFDITVGAFDQSGRAVLVHNQAVEVPLPEDGSNQVREGLLTRLDLPPGRYEIRTAVRDDQSGAVGSVFSFVDVERAADFALSGIVFRGAVPPLMPQHPLSDLIPFVPTVARAIASGSQASAFVRARNNRASESVTMTSTIVDVKGVVRAEQTITIDPEQFVAGSATQTFDLPLADLPRGDYLLRIDAVAGGERRRSEAQFAVK